MCTVYAVLKNKHKLEQNCALWAKVSICNMEAEPIDRLNLENKTIFIMFVKSLHEKKTTVFWVDKII